MSVKLFRIGWMSSMTVPYRMGSKRMANIAHHCAIVLHMLAGEPKPKDIRLRRTVKELAIYIANYCMERYLSKFTNYGLKAQVNEASADNTTPATSAPEHRPLTQEEIDEWYYLRGTLDENGKVIGYGTIGKKLGVDKFSVYNSFNKYEKKMGLKEQSNIFKTRSPSVEVGFFCV